MSDRPSTPARRADADRRYRPAPKPPLSIFTTTLWEYPSQHYSTWLDEEGKLHHTKAAGRTQGEKTYEGATPSWVIWQLLMRYTRKNDLIVDPMVGSGTTIDVARDLDRRPLGYDLASGPGRRDDIYRADARKLPLEAAVADFVFIDPPYSTHINYSDDPACIGKLDASLADPVRPSRHAEPTNPYYAAMRQVIAEIDRILKPRRYMALYVSDSWRKRAKGDPGRGTGEFMPIGFELFNILREYFEPVDIITVVRQNAKLRRGHWHKTAREQNFFLRGFNYLFIMKKP